MPICPQSLSFRPIVLPTSFNLKIKLIDGSKEIAQIHGDGKFYSYLHDKDTLTISKSENAVSIVTNEGQEDDDFIDRVKNYLKWNSIYEKPKQN